MFIRTEFKKIKSIVTEKVCSTTASAADSTSIVPNYNPVSVHCSSGVVWLATDVVATTVNGFKLYEGMILDIGNTGYVSVVSDSTTAKIQAIIWEN